MQDGATGVLGLELLLHLLGLEGVVGVAHRDLGGVRVVGVGLRAGLEDAGTESNPYYTNSSQIPVAYTDDPFEAQEMQEELQTKYTGGTVLHLYMNERISSAAACKELVRRSLTAFRTPYITVTPTFSICPVHGYLVGEHLTCDKCAELHPEAEPVECEVWTRVMGYFRPVRSFNIGKKGEYAERRMFTEVAAGGHGPAVSRLSAVSA